MDIIGGFLIIFSVFYGGLAGSLTFSYFGISSLFMGPIVTFLIHLLLFFILIIKYPVRMDTITKKVIMFAIIGVAIIILNTVLLIMTGRITDFAA